MDGMTRERARPTAPRWRGRWLVAGRAARLAAVTALGAAVAIVGLILLPLPGPGMLVVGVGLAILSTEYRWPARLSRRLRQEARRGARRLRDRRRRG